MASLWEIQEEQARMNRSTDSPAVLAPVDVAAVLELAGRDTPEFGMANVKLATDCREWVRANAAAVEQMAADLAAARKRGDELAEALRHANAGYVYELNRADSLRHRAEAAEPDAARYRHLRRARLIGLLTLLHGNGCALGSGDDADATIDAARGVPVGEEA